MGNSATRVGFNYDPARTWPGQPCHVIHTFKDLSNPFHLSLPLSPSKTFPIQTLCLPFSPFPFQDLSNPPTPHLCPSNRPFQPTSTPYLHLPGPSVYNLPPQNRSQIPAHLHKLTYRPLTHDAFRPIGWRGAGRRAVVIGAAAVEGGHRRKTGVDVG